MEHRSPAVQRSLLPPYEQPAWLQASPLFVGVDRPEGRHRTDGSMPVPVAARHPHHAVTEGLYPRGVKPVFVGRTDDITRVSATASPCFGHKGRKFRESDAFVDLLHRPLVALLLLFLRHPFASHSRPAPMNASSTSAKAAGSRSMSAMVCWIN